MSGGGLTTSVVRNERVKLSAATFNNVGLAFVAAALINPAVSTGAGQGGGVTLWSYVWIGCGVLLHIFAWVLLGELEA